MNNDTVNICEWCGIKYGKYEYENEVLCPECYVSKLESDKLKTFDVRSYLLDGYHMGTEEDLEVVARNINNYLIKNSRRGKGNERD